MGIKPELFIQLLLEQFMIMLMNLRSLSKMDSAEKEYF